MGAFLDIFGFLSVLLRGFSLAFEALTVGGVIFLLVIADPSGGEQLAARLQQWVVRFSLLLAFTQICTVAASSAVLVGSTDLQVTDLAGAEFWKAGCLILAGSLSAAIFARSRQWKPAFAFASLLILAGAIMGSHSMARLEHRPLLMGLTLLHHLGAAAWIGGLPYLLVCLHHLPEGRLAEAVTGRFSRLAMVSAATVVGAGTAMTCFYAGSIPASLETTYGIMLWAKVALTTVLLGLGALNFRIVQAIRRGAHPPLIALRRFGEAEIGIGLTVLLAAASLTSTPPAIDDLSNRVPARDIAERMTPKWPRMETPPVSALSPASPLPTAETGKGPGPYVPGQTTYVNKPADIAWSEYNHHWAGLIVLVVGVLALLSRRWRWAQHWPLAFFGLAIFLLIRADSENWPLGPRGFWESFQVAEVAQHRLFVLLIFLFALFEWRVRTGKEALTRSRLVFPLVCSVGGALLLTHSHSLGNPKEEFLAELSHTPLAIFAVIAGWARWIEIRLPERRAHVAAWIWPICFVFIGSVLMLYRES